MTCAPNSKRWRHEVLIFTVPDQRGTIKSNIRCEKFLTMNLCFDQSLGLGYKSNSQKIRVMSESWVNDNIFCPVCGNARLSKLENNRPVADFQCPSCGEIFELKSKDGKIGRKISDGAYDTMISRITSMTNPDLLVMHYSSLQVVDLTVVPKFFFTPTVIEKRKPLSPTARRAGWVGCNILYGDIPEQGRIPIIENRNFRSTDRIVRDYARIKHLQTESIEGRGWLFDVLNCVNAIPTKDFYLKDIYVFADKLKHQHPDNQNIEAKIRQQLQFLRDKGMIEFLERGHYRKNL